jgi:hypothetical protein
MATDGTLDETWEARTEKGITLVRMTIEATDDFGLAACKQTAEETIRLHTRDDVPPAAVTVRTAYPMRHPIGLVPVP